MAGKAKEANWRDIMRSSLLRSSALIGAVLLGLGAIMLFLALVSYSPSDPSFNTAAGNVEHNWMGLIGSYVSDLLLSLFGIPVVILLPLIAVFAHRLWRDIEQAEWKKQLGWCLLGILLIAFGLSLWFPDSQADLPAGPGGLAGMLVAKATGAGLDAISTSWSGLVSGILTALTVTGGLVLSYFSLRLDRPLFSIPEFRLPKLRRETDTGLVIEPEAGTAKKPRKAPEPRKSVKPDNRPPPEISDRALPPKKASLGKGKQGDFFGPYSLPSIDLLSPAEEQPNNVIDKAGLERNARLLESVLDDFHVKGTINAVRPGPVVTMYELEPAPGIKASRVIQLAEDIARNMSALSARVAAIPGRTVMGIELPNQNREMVSLHEMIGSDSFADQSGQLPIILGKNISGDPVIADLAPMPHLLIAGTTGSGKSVGLNCMIVSLLYRLTPDQCKMIMIDPKMLELSTYDDIPHLLAPVVTEPTKAIRALKWAVEQMEERYRMMSSISVRNLANFNEKVKAAKAKGEPLGRKVQTGYDPETSRPIYEEETLEYEVMPQIVIIVDELADLMMTAGKEVEFLIQRLAQKARAAGIHLIMATQRPSVDVITGVIKANLPTRISFHVTSKIDSRTILGEQGAEQLLGKGDMLYMPGGKQLTRVHGPFVSDDEVRQIADHWRAQGSPEYIQAVTEEPEDGSFALDGADLSDNKEDRQYAQACQIVFEGQKVSTSWLQRQMRIGYNTAARIIDRMEEDEFISPPNHIGRREVLRDQNGEPI
ncbi:DNA segregation ATPase FtsK/SpoIIIE, S-DNA-T family [Parasphingorhabdus marina DSM 22363]|uniref:DNA translocase FtsK n=1 Tax=Parasphingorhabdus marina DSM 22363 TaxID=1123272 RepID=A0A1N6H7A1_9SPHN|nr:DNA translocase FtsK [Parasphingorhabdus marina]SIO15610.1 DNA segregation ATPase FtsK/SpoIIIE, S-DNA-T family [Parasphingorhabdus marina DSM 22363]